MSVTLQTNSLLFIGDPIQLFNLKTQLFPFCKDMFFTSIVHLVEFQGI